jgi:hypothetical protein
MLSSQKPTTVNESARSQEPGARTKFPLTNRNCHNSVLVISCFTPPHTALPDCHDLGRTGHGQFRNSGIYLHAGEHFARGDFSRLLWVAD